LWITIAIFIGAVIIVFTAGGATGALATVSTAVESAVAFFSLLPPPHEAKQNAVAMQNSKPVNLDCLIGFDFF